MKLENTAYNRANLCCGEQEGDTKCEGPAKEAIMLGLKNPTDSVHLVITNASSYYPVYPQYDAKKGKPKLSLMREGWMANGQKNEGKFSDGLLQINQCNNKVMTAKICFISVENKPLYMKSGRVRIFDIDMGADPRRLGPEAVQFRCPGGTFETYGDSPENLLRPRDQENRQHFNSA